MEQAKTPETQPDIVPAGAFIKTNDSLDDILCKERYFAFDEEITELMHEIGYCWAYDEPEENIILKRFWSEIPNPHSPHNIFQLNKQPNYKAWLPVHAFKHYNNRDLDNPVYAIDCDPKTFNKGLELALKLRGLNHVEQLVTGEAESGVVVFENHQGEPLSRLDVQEVANITVEQLQQLVETIIALEERGFRAEEAVYSYHVENGFSLSLLPDSQLKPSTADWRWYYPLHNLCEEASAKMDISMFSAFKEISSLLFEDYQNLLKHCG